jgi:hypothetical protein
VVVYVVAFGIAGVQEIKNADYRVQYPIESIADRVPTPREKAPLNFESGWGSLRLKQIEETTSHYTFERFYREQALRELHRSTFDSFVNSPAFGVGRMSFLPSDRALKSHRSDRPPLQPGNRSTADDGTSPVLTVRDETEIGHFHRDGILDFANPLEFGMVDSRTRTAGFTPHGFTKVPTAGENWQIQTVELIGLLRHPEPTVYISFRLPAMDELKDAPTRPPDTFESAGLELIRKGDDLVAAETQDGNRMRLLGSIRNGNTCIKCHGGDRGDLLGAFSYVLSRK